MAGDVVELLVLLDPEVLTPSTTMVIVSVVVDQFP